MTAALGMGGVIVVGLLWWLHHRAGESRGVRVAAKGGLLNRVRDSEREAVWIAYPSRRQARARRRWK